MNVFEIRRGRAYHKFTYWVLLPNIGQVLKEGVTEEYGHHLEVVLSGSVHLLLPLPPRATVCLLVQLSRRYETN